MKKLRIFLIGLAVVIFITGLCFLAYRLYIKVQIPTASPYSAIPENTAIIIKLNKAGKLWEELNRSNLLWKELTRFPGIKSIQDEIRQMDSVCRKNQKFNKLVRQYNLIISISVSGRSSFGALYLTTLPGPRPEHELLTFLKDFMEEKATLVETPYAETRIYRFSSGEKGSPFYFAVLKGVFMGSYRSDLVKKSIDRLSLNTPTVASGGFRKVESTTGKNVDANIYINYRYFSMILLKITREEALPDLLKVARFADWSGMDVLIKKDELLLTGYTTATDSSVYFLSLFNNQYPQKIEITATIPASCSYFTFFGWNDPGQYMKRYLSRKLRNDAYSGKFPKTPSIFDQNALDLSAYFTPWIGNQACLAVIESNSKPQQNITFASFKCLDTLLTRQYLRKLADTLGMKSDSLIYKGHSIYGMNFTSPLPIIFGELFEKSQAKFYGFLQDYVVFCSQRKDFQYLVDEEMAGNMLSKNKDYLDFFSEFPDNANVFYYFNTRNASSSLKNILTDELNFNLKPLTDSIKKFQSLALQFNNQEGMFYSSMYLRFNPNLSQEGPLLWQTALDTTLLGKPEIINDLGIPLIVAWDVSGNLYGVDPEGKILWKNKIMGKIRDRVHSILLPGMDSALILFNTDTHLYLIHADGRLADRFPMRFPLRATNGLTLIDHNNQKDYRILVAFEDQRVYTFTLSGKSVNSWDPPHLKEDIILPVIHKKISGVDYILISGDKGKVMIVDQNGKTSINLSPKFGHSPNSGFYLNRTNRKGLFVTTEPDGKVIFITSGGKINEATLNLFSNDHYFFYEDITGNGSPEFIVFDRNTLYYYNRYYKLIYSYTFRREILTPPFLLHSPAGKAMIGLVAPDTRELFLFDHHGLREMETGLRGTTPFSIVSLGNYSQTSLVVGSGKMLKNYRLTKP